MASNWQFLNTKTNGENLVTSELFEFTVFELAGDYYTSETV